MTTSQRPKRLLSLDVMRGITIAGMILVNNPGSWSNIFAPLRHAEWHGLTPTDLVFPFFMFIMGVSACLSLSKQGFKATKAGVWKIVKRAFLIMVVGWALAWLGMAAAGLSRPGANAWDAVMCFDRIRIPGVLTRLGLCYGISALLALCFSRKWLTRLTVLLLAAYAVILLVGNGLAFSTDSILYRFDHALLSENHLYTDWVGGEALKLDPEGLLGTIPSVAHCLIGMLCGMMILGCKENKERALNLFVIGTCLAFAGFLLSYGLPLNKKIWSPTFVLTTCGLASLLLGLLIWTIDIKRHNGWCKFFNVYGVNPLFLYVLAAVLSILAGAIKVPYAASESGLISLHGWYYTSVATALGAGNPYFANLIQALTYVMLTWLAGLWLYNKKIYIKL